MKLLDFGLARREQAGRQPHRRHPRLHLARARARPARRALRADLYAFGVLAFHLLTGQLPFLGTTPMEVMEQHVHAPPPVPHEVNDTIPSR